VAATEAAVLPAGPAPMTTNRTGTTPGYRRPSGPPGGCAVRVGDGSNLRAVPEIRHDPLSGRNVIIAPGRAARPHGFTAHGGGPPDPRRTGKGNGGGGDPGSDGGSRSDVARRPDDDRVKEREGCPFCPGHESMTPPEVARRGPGPADGPGWRVRVVPNLYPFTDAHEVVVLSPDHDRAFGALDAPAAAEALAVMRDRTAHHLRRGCAYVQALVNHGRAAGASLPHPHAQVVGLDTVPPEATALAARFDSAGADLVARQSAAAAEGGLVVLDGPAAAWCPAAPAMPYQMTVAHRTAGPRFDEASDAVIGETAAALGGALARLGSAAGDPPYNVIVHTAPPSLTAGTFHWYLEVLPRISVVAAFEYGTGVFVNTVSPDDAAAALREADPART